MEKEATFPYSVIRVPDAKAANCIYVNGTVIHRAAAEYPESAKVFAELAAGGCDALDCNFSEIAKADVNVSYFSLRFHNPNPQLHARLDYYITPRLNAAFSFYIGVLDLLLHIDKENEAHQKPLGYTPYEFAADETQLPLKKP